MYSMLLYVADVLLSYVKHYLIQMQLTVAEDLLRNTEKLAVVIGGVLEAASDNTTNNNMTITQDNIGM